MALLMTTEDRVTKIPSGTGKTHYSNTTGKNNPQKIINKS